MPLMTHLMSHFQSKMVITKKDLEKDGWRISDEGFNYLIGQFDDEPTYQVEFKKRTTFDRAFDKKYYQDLKMEMNLR